jgi:hypothetical protein
VSEVNDESYEENHGRRNYCCGIDPEWLVRCRSRISISSYSFRLDRAARLRAVRGDVVPELFGKDHFLASSDIGRYNDPTTIAVHNFLNSVLGRKETRVLKGCCPASPSLPPRNQAAQPAAR